MYDKYSSIKMQIIETHEKSISRTLYRTIKLCRVIIFAHFVGAAASIPQIYIPHIIDFTIYFTEIVYKKSNNSLNKMYMYIKKNIVSVRFYIYLFYWIRLYDTVCMTSFLFFLNINDISFETNICTVHVINDSKG